MPPKVSNSMDAVQIMLAKANETNSVDLPIYGKTITINYKPIGWRKINRAISYAMEYSQDPITKQMNGTFRIDKYYTYALNEMIINPPFPMTETFWDALPREAGAILENLVPNPFSLGNDANEVVEESGKGLEVSSEETEQ